VDAFNVELQAYKAKARAFKTEGERWNKIGKDVNAAAGWIGFSDWSPLPVPLHR
jgi:hypothetical protein